MPLFEAFGVCLSLFNFAAVARHIRKFVARDFRDAEIDESVPGLSVLQLYPDVGCCRDS